MILWEAVLVTTAATVVVVNGRVPQQADLNTALVQEQENIGELNIDQKPVPVKQNLDNGLVREENDLDISTITDSEDLDNTGLVKEQHDLDDEGIQHASDKGIVREQNDFGISTITDTDDLDNNLLEEQHDLDDAGISMDKTGLSRNSGKRSLFDLWESIIERNKSCTPTVSCSHAGGHCFSSGSKCSGAVDAYGCIGGGRCMCCIPVTTSTIHTTTPNATDTTAAPTTTPRATTSTIITTTPNDTCTTKAPTTTLKGCQGGFLVLGQCFKIFTDIERRWDDAQSKCRSENLILAEPSDSVAATLREYVLKNYGTGIYQCWLGARGDGSKFVWQHSGKYLFNNNTLWDHGYLNSGLMSTSNCLELDVYQSQWESKPAKPYDIYSCTGLRWTLCEDATSTIPTTTDVTLTSLTSDATSTIPTPTTTASTTSSSGLECPGGFLMMNQCFRIFNDTTRIWEDAQSKCRSENLILAEPSDSVAAPLREYVLKNYGTGDYQCWLGARGDGSKFVWQHSGRYLLNNNTLWNQGYLNSGLMSTSYCLELDALQVEWVNNPGEPYDSYSCKSRRWTLCQDTTSSIPTTSASTFSSTSSDTTSTLQTTSVGASITTTSECPGGFMMMNQCFRIFNDTTRSWEDAHAKCQSENLILAEPSDSVAVPLREYVLKNYGTGDYQCWLGARGDGSKFVWQHSGKFLFNNNTLWDTGYLSNGYMATSFCLELDVLQSQWSHHPGKPYDSWGCTTLHWTLCENTTSTNPTTTAATFTSSTSDTTTTTTPTTTTAATTTTTTDTTTTTTPTTTTAATTTTTTVTTTTTTPTATTSAPTTTTTESECPGGFMMMNKCFRIFNDTTRSWEDAESKCRSENLILAEPSDSVAAPLREYVLKNYGTGDYQCWLGARSDGSKFVWQHSGRSLLSNNTLWDYKYMSTSFCLELDVLQSQWESKPGRPYDSVDCATSRWTLCQVPAPLLVIPTANTTKINWADSVRRCQNMGAQPFVPQTRQDFEIIKNVRLELGSSGYLWLPAADHIQEGSLKWWNGQDASGSQGLIWVKSAEMHANSASWDCLLYGTWSLGGVHMYPCSSREYPMICSKMN